LRAFIQRIWENVIANVVALLILAAVGWLAAFLWTRNVGLAISVFFNVALLGLCGWLLWQNRKLWRQQKAAYVRAQKVGEARRPSPLAKPEYELLPDPKNMTRLNIDNSLLTKLYAEVKTLATKWSDDAKFCHFYIGVHPFMYPGYYKVGIFFEFFSTWARQSRAWHFDEYGSISEVPPPNPYKGEGATVFSVLPWEEYPDWLETLHKAYTQIGPLPEVPYTEYALHVFSYPASPCRWMAVFIDGVSGREYIYEWDSTRGLRRLS